MENIKYSNFMILFFFPTKQRREERLRNVQESRGRTKSIAGAGGGRVLIKRGWAFWFWSCSILVGCEGNLEWPGFAMSAKKQWRVQIVLGIF